MAEAEWDDDTRQLVLGLDAVDLCPVCGRPSSLCQDPARQFDWEASKPIRCHAQTALLRAQQGVTEETNPQMHALMWSVTLRGAKEEVAAGG